MAEPATTTNPKKVRVGLAMVSVIFAAAIVLIFVVDDTVGQAIFFAIAMLTLVRVVLLARWLRKEANAKT